MHKIIISRMQKKLKVTEIKLIFTLLTEIM